MSGSAQPAPFNENQRPLYPLAGIGAAIVGLTLAAPFAFQAGGDNAFIALAVPAGLLTLAATRVAERTPGHQALCLIFGIGVLLRSTRGVAPLSSMLIVAETASM